jgi:hypothetical protein
LGGPAGILRIILIARDIAQRDGPIVTFPLPVDAQLCAKIAFSGLFWRYRRYSAGKQSGNLPWSITTLAAMSAKSETMPIGMPSWMRN